jgi:signal-transduction protein with cAMP-binding, CBS, and nucleotidyltransferase domain
MFFDCSNRPRGSRADIVDYNVEVDLTPCIQCLKKKKKSTLVNVDINLTVYTVTEGFAVSEALVMFRTLSLRHLIVVGGNELRGIITKKDLMEHNCIEKYKDLKRYTKNK